MSDLQPSPVNLIACGVFKPALEFLDVELAFPQLRIVWLPSQLHAQPTNLQSHLIETVTSLQDRKQKIACLYGQCFPGIDTFCREQGVCRIRGDHCYEIFLGSHHFQQLMAQTAGTFFLEQDLLIHFEEYCALPLELHDDEMRRLLFRHYRRLVYLRQPRDPELVDRARAIGKLLNLSLEVIDVEYKHLQQRLRQIIRPCQNDQNQP